MLATLLRPDAGYARVCCADIVRQADRVRELIGLTGQYAAVDEDLTGFENLLLIGRLLEVPRAEAKRRSGELLEQFGLAPDPDPGLLLQRRVRHRSACSNRTKVACDAIAGR